MPKGSPLHSISWLAKVPGCCAAGILPRCTAVGSVRVFEGGVEGGFEGGFEGNGSKECWKNCMLKSLLSIFVSLLLV